MGTLSFGRTVDSTVAIENTMGKSIPKPQGMGSVKEQHSADSFLHGDKGEPMWGDMQSSDSPEAQPVNPASTSDKTPERAFEHNPLRSTINTVTTDKNMPIVPDNDTNYPTDQTTVVI